ncbi:MAG: multifunctional CCA addition/repair protein [Wenzhouxiangella sp.]
MDVFEVGGAVRDRLMGVDAPDRDYVVVGATPEDMVKRGFRPVGRDFPVFLHPKTHEEYALARTERKSGRGYRGFVFHAGRDVSLVDDLARRDLTVNAMALDSSGLLIDPYQGRIDLERRILRHVSPAFREDPVRILRLARFATRFEDFRIADETLALCRQMVTEGEVAYLVPERVWQEMAKALMYPRPSRFFDVLRQVGALAVILPEVDALFGVPQSARYHPEIDSGRHSLMVLDRAAELDASLAVRFSALVHDLGKALTPREAWPAHHGHEKAGLEPIAALCDRLAVPNRCRELALRVCANHLLAHRALELKPGKVLSLLERLDGLRRPEQVDAFLLACQADWQGRGNQASAAYPQADYLRQALASVRSVQASAFLEQGLEGPKIGEAMRQARLQAIAGLAH